MKIIAIHKGFACDHSSTSYEFLAIDKPLSEKARRDVSSLSSRANPTRRRVSFIYHADGYDIPGGWKKLMRHFDVMYSESYGWWTLAMAYNATKKQQEAVSRYDFSGMDELGVSVGCQGNRVTVAVRCRVNNELLYAIEHEFGDSDEDYDNEFDGEFDEDDIDTTEFESNDGLLNLLARVRQQLIEADYRALYAVWEIYGWDVDDDDEEAPPRPRNKKQGKDTLEEFQSLLTTE